MAKKYIEKQRGRSGTGQAREAQRTGTEQGGEAGFGPRDTEKEQYRAPEGKEITSDPRNA